MISHIINEGLCSLRVQSMGFSGSGPVHTISPQDEVISLGASPEDSQLQGASLDATESKVGAANVCEVRRCCCFKSHHVSAISLNNGEGWAG